MKNDTEFMFRDWWTAMISMQVLSKDVLAYCIKLISE
jgi:hypothetical protein